jgi:hypothetical protein
MNVADDLNAFIESEGDTSSRLKANVARALALIGWLLIGFNLNGIIFSSFPLKLAQPEWQLNFIAKLLSTSTSLLLSAILIILAQVFNPRNKILKDWNRTVTRLAALFAVLLVLSIPLQFYIGSRALKNQTNRAYEAMNNIKTLVKGINATNSETEFRLYLGSLPNQRTLPDKFDAPFPVIKQRALDNMQAQLNAATENMKTQKSQELQVFLAEAIRNTAQCILLAAAFSALAGINSQSSNIITRFFDGLL